MQTTMTIKEIRDARITEVLQHLLTLYPVTTQEPVKITSRQTGKEATLQYDHLVNYLQCTPINFLLEDVGGFYASPYSRHNNPLKRYDITPKASVFWALVETFTQRPQMLTFTPALSKSLKAVYDGTEGGDALIEHALFYAYAASSVSRLRRLLETNDERGIGLFHRPMIQDAAISANLWSLDRLFDTPTQNPFSQGPFQAQK